MAMLLAVVFVVGVASTMAQTLEQALKLKGFPALSAVGGDATKPSPPSWPDAQLLVVGNNSDNIVRFDLSTGKATVVAKLATGSRPWSIAVSSEGNIYVGLHGNKKNIVRLVPSQRGPSDAPLVAEDLTGTIGRFGPGLMAFDKRGTLNVAGDTIRAVLRYDVTTGELIESMRMRAANLVGLTLAGESVYVAEYFQKTILRWDLAADPAAGKKFIYKSSHLDRAHGMTVGHNGNLFVSNLLNSLIQEFDKETGKFVRTFLDVHTIGGRTVKDLHFEPRMDRYFLTSGDAVYVFSTDGALVAKHESIALAGAVAVATVGRQRVAATTTTNSGLIGYVTKGGSQIPVALRYQHGKVLQPDKLVGRVTSAGQTPKDVTLTFRGHLHVPKEMTVNVFVSGGSSNGGDCWLSVGNWKVGPLGDDHIKRATDQLVLNAGDYPIVWTLSGGDFGCGLVKFTNASTSQLLSVQHARTDLKDVQIEETIYVSSEQPGWPVNIDWIDHTATDWNVPVKDAVRQ
jgi:sugar lactone lactonase YvrE